MQTALGPLVPQQQWCPRSLQLSLAEGPPLGGEAPARPGGQAGEPGITPHVGLGGGGRTTFSAQHADTSHLVMG